VDRSDGYFCVDNCHGLYHLSHRTCEVRSTAWNQQSLCSDPIRVRAISCPCPMNRRDSVHIAWVALKCLPMMFIPYSLPMHMSTPEMQRPVSFPRVKISRIWPYADSHCTFRGLSSILSVGWDEHWAGIVPWQVFELGVLRPVLESTSDFRVR